MSNAYYHNHDYQTDVIIFGGNIQRKSKFDKHVVTEMRLLKFGELSFNYIILHTNENLYIPQAKIAALQQLNPQLAMCITQCIT